eukprot:CAMPEP_0185822350 /NCGR_PEP_ID=MMETSP1322-20130828/26615_1 /TAXON_ID=265543 /ORGANISM="Minutocellus polymorphus, Strain RCC2270" /LENGTH=119 /DNA_ID=CAMNT_0028519799 /DNA_START=293 /DNA_END=652 /DNA_ORIENTATION=+
MAELGWQDGSDDGPMLGTEPMGASLGASLGTSLGMSLLLQLASSHGTLLGTSLGALLDTSLGAELVPALGLTDGVVWAVSRFVTRLRFPPKFRGLDLVVLVAIWIISGTVSPRGSIGGC